MVITALLAAAFGGLMQLWAVREKAPHSWAGFWLGLCESFIFMATFAGASVVGGGWLALKVASKWKSWDMIKSDDTKTKTALTYGHRAFLLGTAGNIVIGLIGAFIAMGLLGAKSFLSASP